MSTESIGQDSQTFSPSQSPAAAAAPIPFPTVTVHSSTFGEMIEPLLEGHKVRRVSWPNGEVVFFKDGILAIRRGGAEYDQWTISRADFENADDWHVAD